MDTKIRIGNIDLKSKYILAPMAGFTDIGLRALSYGYGAGLCCGEMVSAKGLVYGGENTKQLLATDASEPIKVVQLFGSEIPFIVKAVKLDLLNDFDIIDFNFGCPMKKIVSNGEGSALMDRPKQIYEIIRSIVDNTNKVVTAKIRAGYSKSNKNAVEVAKLIEQAGASAITVHGRTKDMYYSGTVDYEIIKNVVEAVDIPVFGNGDVIDKDTAQNMFLKTNCAGIAIGRGAVGSPYIFSVLENRGVTYTIGSLIKDHIKILSTSMPDKVIVNYMKKHIAAYLKGIRGGKDIKHTIYSMKSIDDLHQLLSTNEEIFSRVYNI